MQRPLLQTLPEAQVTPEQRFSTHWPLTQTWLPEHCTLAQASAAEQVVLHASPDGQLMVLQLLSLVHLPLLLSQNCPEEQVTPLHGAGKHPATQLPWMQVSSLEQVLPAHRSVTGTQASWQVMPPILPAPPPGPGGPAEPPLPVAVVVPPLPVGPDLPPVPDAAEPPCPVTLPAPPVPAPPVPVCDDDELPQLTSTIAVSSSAADWDDRARTRGRVMLPPGAQWRRRGRRLGKNSAVVGQCPAAALGATPRAADPLPAIFLLRIRSIAAESSSTLTGLTT